MSDLNSKRIGGRIEADDDVEGHGTLRGGIEGETPDDVEGHAARVRILDAEQPSDEDVEGHGALPRTGQPPHEMDRRRD